MLDRPAKPPFSEGQHVYYPGTGVATIIAIEEMEVAGFTTTVYDLVHKDGSHVKVPLSKAAKNGLRNIGTRQQLDAAVDIIKGRSRVGAKTWQVRAQASEAKLHSGDMCVVVEVIRDLYVSEDTEDRSDTARRLYEQAFRLFLPEAALILGMTDQGTLMHLASETGKVFKPSLGTGMRESAPVGSPKRGRPPSAPAATAEKKPSAEQPTAPRSLASPSATRPTPVPAPRPPAAAHTAPRPVPERAPAKPAVTEHASSVASADNGYDARIQELTATIAELRGTLASLRAEHTGLQQQLVTAHNLHRADNGALHAQVAARTLEVKTLEKKLLAVSCELLNVQKQLRSAHEKLEAQAFGIADLETVHRNEIGRLQELLLLACTAFFASEAERSRMTDVVTSPHSDTEEAPVAANPRPKKRSGLKRQPGGFLWDPKWDRQMAQKRKR